MLKAINMFLQLCHQPDGFLHRVSVVSPEQMPSDLGQESQTHLPTLYFAK